jgi:low affinity Fe/Cu permease
VERHDREGGRRPSRRRIDNRTAQLPIWSRILYKIEHYTVLPAVALGATLAVIGLVISISVRGFPGHWVAGFEISVSSITLVMVFAIQHTQGREQAATQRKLDELIRALPGANPELMMLEEASRHDMLKVEDSQRDARSSVPDVEGT